jgi:hypothetical protein
LAPSVDSLQKLVNLCQFELSVLELAINVNKSVSGLDHILMPRVIALALDGATLQWVDTVRYLGVYIVRSRTFKFV